MLCEAIYQHNSADWGGKDCSLQQLSRNDHTPPGCESFSLIGKVTLLQWSRVEIDSVLIRAIRKPLESRIEYRTFGHSFACLSNCIQHFQVAVEEGKTVLLAFCWQWAGSAVSIHIWNLAAAATILLIRTLNAIVQCKQCKGPCFHEKSKL